MAKSKFFRVFVAGQTISDGRTIDDAWIDQIVETFNVETYAPRINVEHISGYSPEPPFNGYGTVIAVKAQTDEITIAGKTEQRRALYAQIEANDQLLALVEKDQKPFPSVELTESYAGIGKVGLVGLAFTDKPASIATQSPKFSRSAPGTLFASTGERVTIEFEPAPADPTGIAAAIRAGFASVGALFAKQEEKPPVEEPKKAANDNFDVAAFSAALGEQTGKLVADVVRPVSEALAALQGDFTALKTQLEGTDDGKRQRSFSTGGDGKGAASGPTADQHPQTALPRPNSFQGPPRCVTTPAISTTPISRTSPT